MTELPDWKYTSTYGFRNSPYKKRSYVRKAALDKKVKVEIPAFKIEKIFENIDECADFLGIEFSRAYSYICHGRAAKGLILFSWVKENDQKS